MDKRAQKIVTISLSFIIVWASQVALSFAPSSSSKMIATSGTIAYNTHTVSTLTELTDAISKAAPGDTVLIRGGIYQPTSRVNFKTSGSPGSPITYEAYPGEEVIFDGSLATQASLEGGWEPPLVTIYSNWNTFRNIEVRNSPGSGIWIGYQGSSFGNDIVLDHVETHNNKGIGAVTYGSRCQFLYCVAHDNVDSQNTVPGQDADGLGVGSLGSGNYFLGCLSYGNSDDGFDMYGSTGNRLEKCVAYSNGLLQGNGQGFKLATGGSNRVSKCIAYNNRDVGFSSEEDAINNVVDHCTAYNNGRTDFMSAYSTSNVFTNNVGRFNWWQAEPVHYTNTWDLGILSYGFMSTDPASSDCLSLSASSSCRSKASDGSDLGALQYGEKIINLLSN